jgi:hypothetical protein
MLMDKPREVWFAVSLFFRSVHNNRPQPDDLWEESIVVLKVADREEARREAERWGKAQEHEYVSVTGDQVRWSFEQIESIYEILEDALEDRTEVFSRFLSASDVRALSSPS